MQEQLKKKAEEILCVALEIESPEQREIYLNHACRKSARLRAMVEEMLALQPVLGRFFGGLEAARLLVEAESRRGKRVPNECGMRSAEREITSLGA